MPDDVILESTLELSQVNSDIAICNLALLKIGNADNYITAFDDSTKEARACRAFYTHVLGICCDDYPWNCMINTVTLVVDVDVPAFGYDHTYPLPDDCLRILSLSETGTADDEDVEYRRIGRYIYTNADTLYLTYIYHNTDVATYDHRFIQAFAARLAIELCKSITRDPSILRDLWVEYKEIISEMRLNDALESYPKQRGYSEMVNVRT